MSTALTSPKSGTGSGHTHNAPLAAGSGYSAAELHTESSQFGCILFDLAQIRLTVLHLAVFVRPLERLIL